MKILIISNYFAPENVIGAIRMSKIAKYLIRAGHELTIISSKLEEYDKTDNTIECAELDKATRITIPFSKIVTLPTKVYKREANGKSSHLISNRLDKSIKAKIYKIIRRGFTSYRDYEWTVKAKRIIRNLSREYDVVISSYPDVATHNVAYYTKKTGKAKKWIADFRDPIVLDSSKGIDRSRKMRLQANIIHKADMATFVSKAGVKSFICYKGDRGKVKWISNGFDEEDVCRLDKNIQRSQEYKDKLIFSYAGGLYSGERDLSALFHALKELIDDNKISMDDVLVRYAGRDIGLLRSQAEEYGVSFLIEDAGYLSRDDSLMMQLKSDCVVVCTWCYKTNEGPITGKIYEPVMMRKPILLLIRGEGKRSEPGAFVRYLNTGTVYEESEDGEDVFKIKQMILEMLEEKRKTGMVKSNIDDKRREKFSYQLIARKFLSYIETMK